jgi:hypothetical protein
MPTLDDNPYGNANDSWKLNTNDITDDDSDENLNDEIKYKPNKNPDKNPNGNITRQLNMIT